MGWTTPKTWATGELVTASDLNLQLRDNLSFLLAPTYHEAVGSGTDFSTTSTSNVDITGMTLNITTSGGNLLVVGFGKISCASGYTVTLAINIDGTDYDVNEAATVGSALFVCAFRRFALSAGAHTVKLRLRSNSGAHVATFAGGIHRRLLAVEGVL